MSSDLKERQVRRRSGKVPAGESNEANDHWAGTARRCRSCGQVGVAGSFRASQRSRAARASHEYTTAVLANRSCQAYRRRLVRMPRNPKPKTMMLSGRVRVRMTA
jgi:hypothetical protein